MKYLDLKISLKTIIQFVGLSLLLYSFINLSSKYYNNNYIMFVLCFSFFISMYFLFDYTSTLSNESIKIDKRTKEELEIDNIKEKIKLLNAAQNQVILESSSKSNYNLMENIEKLEEIKQAYRRKLDNEIYRKQFTRIKKGIKKVWKT